MEHRYRKRGKTVFGGSLLSWPEPSSSIESRTSTRFPRQRKNWIPLSIDWKKGNRKLRNAIAIALLLNLIFVPVADAKPDDPPQPYECPGSNTHVWDKDQCPRLDGPFQIGSGGGGRCSLACAIGGLLGGLTGGLL